MSTQICCCCGVRSLNNEERPEPVKFTAIQEDYEMLVTIAFINAFLHKILNCSGNGSRW